MLWSLSLLNCLWHEWELLAEKRDRGWPQWIQNKTTLKEGLSIRNWIINWLCNLKLSAGKYVCIYEKKRMLNASSLEASVKAQEMPEFGFCIYFLWENSRYLLKVDFSIEQKHYSPMKNCENKLLGKMFSVQQPISFLCTTFDACFCSPICMSSYCLCFFLHLF